MNGQSFGGLYHPQHDLPHDPAILRQAKAPDLVREFRAAFGTDRRQIVEDDRQLLIDQGAQKTGQDLIHRLGAICQRIHGAQQMLMGDRLGGDFRNAGAFQPAQDAQLRFGITQTVEDHHP
jgi:hypothetical protein